MSVFGLSASPAAAQVAGGESLAVRKHVTLLGIASATVAPHGMVFVSLSASSQLSAVSDDLDDSIAFGFGLGDATSGVGLQVTSILTSLANGFGDSGYFNLKVSRLISQGATPVYLGLSVDHIGSWGSAQGVSERVSVLVTAFPEITLGENAETYPLMLTLGAGSGARQNGTKPGIFLGAGIGLTETLGASAAWTGEIVTLGASYKPRNTNNLNFTATLEDVADQQGNRRVSVSVSWFLQNAFRG